MFRVGFVVALAVVGCAHDEIAVKNIDIEEVTRGGVEGDGDQLLEIVVAKVSEDFLGMAGDDQRLDNAVITVNNTDAFTQVDNDCCSSTYSVSRSGYSSDIVITIK